MNRFCLIVGMVGGIGALCRADGTITGVGEVQPGRVSVVTGISANGLMVTGYSTIPPGQIPSLDYKAFRWASLTGIQPLGLAMDPSQAWSANADGSVIVGLATFGSQSRAFRWTQSGGFENLGVLPGYDSQSGALAVSANGNVIAGYSLLNGLPPQGSGFRWNAADGLSGLAFTGSTWGVATGVSAAGDVITGRSGTQSYRWTMAGGLQPVPVPTGYAMAVTNGISADGTTVYGRCAVDVSFPSPDVRAFYWRQGREPIAIPTLPGFTWGELRAASADGGILVGAYKPAENAASSAGAALLWTRALGPLRLNQYLSNSVNLSGWTLYEAVGISGDGRTIVGNGSHEVSPGVFRDEGWVITLTSAPNTCYANIDGSTAPPILNANDFQSFLGHFAAGAHVANCDDSQTPPVLNINDFQCFLNAFAAGCS